MKANWTIDKNKDVLIMKFSKVFKINIHWRRLGMVLEKERPKNFVMIGITGYRTCRYLQAIKSTENILIAALDKSDSVGILDRFFEDEFYHITARSVRKRNILYFDTDKNAFLDKTNVKCKDANQWGFYT